MNIKLRLARSGDARTLSAMSRDLIEAGLGWHYHPRRLERLIGDPDTTAVVACVGQRVVGFAIMEFGDERAHLVLLAVRPNCRRQGIGRRLLNWLVESALTAGIASVHLELRVDNEAARAFYRALDFVETLSVPGYYRGREAALRMVRTLRPAGLVPVRWMPPFLKRY